MKKVFYFIATFTIISCSKKKEPIPSGPQGSLPAQSVQVVIVKMAPLENSINATGTILSNEEVEIRSEIQGRITGLYFKEGERVQSGKLLVKIDDKELNAQLKKTELSILLAKEDESRKRKLLDINGISKEEYDQSQNNLLKLEADKDLLQIQINKTNIIAPFSGTIGLRYISEGGFVSSSDLITVLHQSDPVKVEFSVPEKYAALLNNGSVVNFTVEGDLNNYTAKVYAKEPKIDPATRTVKVRAISANPGNKLIPGAFAKLQISLETINEAIVLPSNALIPTISGQSVLVVKNGVASLQLVKTGIRTENTTQITDGLMLGDSVIVTGLLTVRDGMPVKPVLISSPKENKVQE